MNITSSLSNLSQIEKDSFQFTKDYKNYRQSLREVEGIQTQLTSTKSILLDQEKQLSKLQTSWKGFFVKILDKEGFVGKICKWLTNFKWFNEEFLRQSPFKNKITESKTQIQKLESAYTLKNKIFLPLKKTYEENKSKFTSKNAAYQLMMEIFGGKENYKSFPVLDLKNRQGSTDYIDFISPNELKAPIMTFTDMHGREGITFRFVQIRDGKAVTSPQVQTFFQRYKDDSNWSSTSHYPIIVNGYIFDSIEGAQERPLQHLKTLISTGKIVLPSSSPDTLPLEFKLV